MCDNFQNTEYNFPFYKQTCPTNYVHRNLVSQRQNNLVDIQQLYFCLKQQQDRLLHSALLKDLASSYWNEPYQIREKIYNKLTQENFACSEKHNLFLPFNLVVLEAAISLTVQVSGHNVATEVRIVFSSLSAKLHNMCPLG